MLEPLNMRRDGAAEGTAIAPRLVGQRLDWITLAFRVVLLPEALAHLAARADVAAKNGGKSAITLGTGPGAWTGEIRRDKQGRFLLESPRERVLVWESAPGGVEVEGRAAPGWNVSIDQSGVALLASGRDVAIAEAWRLCALLGTPLESRRRRMDLAVDVVGFQIDGEADARKMVKRSKKPAAGYMGKRGVRGGATTPLDFAEVDEGDTRYRLHGFGHATQTLSVGAGGKVQLRAYDKSTELAHAARDWKREAEEWGWSRHGWTGERVTRIEFQVMGEALEQFEAEHHADDETRGMRRGALLLDVDPVLARASLTACEAARQHDRSVVVLERLDADAAWRLRAAGACAEKDAAKLAGELDALWQYLTRKWIRIVVPGTATRLSRCAVDPRWDAIQRVTWTRGGAQPFKRFRRPTGTLSRNLLGMALSHKGRTGHLPPLVDPRTGEIIEDGEAYALALPPDERRQLVSSAVFGILASTAQTVAADLLGDFDDAGAVAYLVEKYNAKRARFDRSFAEVWTPPPPVDGDWRPVRAWLPAKCKTTRVTDAGRTVEMFG